jgi:hypothetical protein
VATLRRLARRFHIEAFVDDDAAVVDAARAAGFTVLHASWMGAEPATGGSGSASATPTAAGRDRSRGPGEPGAGAEVSLADAQEVLFEIQETEGRT